MVGVFWWHRRRVLGKRDSLADAELYGQCLVSRINHYKLWPTVQLAHPELAGVEYEYVPRGRVVCDVIDQRFIIISSARLIASKTAVAAIRRRYRLDNDLTVNLQTDLHYEDPRNLTWPDDD